ncbi:hypothetical protein F907_00817 [Acinetobacter colistiniresistens]|uniref:DUF551 domain-containing protein n=1 Tax=Acinetobacter colistiniresistens TaxID=280145 RepID=S3TID8_9GAMM|nr:DUF551 domain-containing protein [Acinetobacter colistiniresistens]EPG39514.1 hypothetical protein F907_00817 [Acinetobacter colistiniresistens]
MNIGKEREAFEAVWLVPHELGFFEFKDNQYVLKDNYADDSESPIANETYHSLNSGWSMWLKAKADEAKKLEGCVVVPEWISTKEFLPAEGVEVLVHRYGQVIQATKDSGYAGGFKERNCYGWQATFDVTYWMPKNFKLPESYSFYYNDEHPYKVTMVEAARGGN